MISDNDKECPICGGNLKYYDTVRRIVRTKDRATAHIYVRRLRCTQCQRLHRELPQNVLPYKQYEAILIYAVADGLITVGTFGYEDYPCEATMRRWVREIYK